MAKSAWNIDRQQCPLPSNQTVFAKRNSPFFRNSILYSAECVPIFARLILFAKHFAVEGRGEYNTHSHKDVCAWIYILAIVCHQTSSLFSHHIHFKLSHMCKAQTILTSLDWLKQKLSFKTMMHRNDLLTTSAICSI